MADINDILSLLEGSEDRDLQRRMEAWTGESEAGAQEFELYQAIWKSADGMKDHQSVDTDVAWFNMNRKLRSRNSGLARRFRIYRALTAAASIVILVFFGWLAFRMDPDVREIYVKTGDTDHEILLSDHSIIRIDSQSSILAPGSFENLPERNVYVRGKVEMHVTPIATSPMTITTPSTGITVLGTEFILESGSDHATLENISGELRFFSLEDTEKFVMLLPGDKFTFDGTEFIDENPDTIQPVAQPPDPGSGRTYYFEDLLEMLLSRYHNVYTEIRYHFRPDSLHLNLNQPLEGILMQLDSTIDFRYVNRDSPAGPYIEITRFSPKKEKE